MSVDVPTQLDAGLFSDDHVAYRESVETFLARQVIPEYGEWTRAREIPRSVLTQAGEDGFLGMGVPESYNGLGADDARFGAVVSTAAMEAGVPALALVLGLHSDVVVKAVAAHGNEATRERWLAALATGETVGTLVEGDLQITHDRTGTVINGHAQFVPFGAHADLLLVSANGGAVLVEPGAPGVSVALSDEGIGLAAAGFGDISFENAVGGQLQPGAQDGVGVSRDLLVALTAAAGAREAVTLTADYVRERKVFGVPLGSLENTREVIATMVALTDSATALAEQTLRSEVHATLTPARAAAAARHCIRAYLEIVDHGVQMHGGYGYILEYPIARAYADAQFWAVHGAVTAVRREAVAATLLD